MGAVVGELWLRAAGPGRLGLRQRQPRDRHAVGRAADVVDAELGEEAERGGIARVLAADADLEARIGATAALDGDAHELADALLVERDEGIEVVEPLALIGGE